MPQKSHDGYRHFLFDHQGVVHSFTPPPSRGSSIKFPPRERQQHAARLNNQLACIQEAADRIHKERVATGLSTEWGLLLEFTSDGGFPLNVDSLDKSGLTLLNVRKRLVVIKGKQEEMTLATVRVPFGKLDVLVKKIEAYRSQQTLNGHYKNEKLVATIAEIRIAALEAFWTEEEKPMPDCKEPTAWEVWLHVGDGEDGRQSVLQLFRQQAAALKIDIERPQINLPENTVLLIRATRQQLEQSLDLLNCLTELRAPQVTASFFTAMSPIEQNAWTADLLERVIPPGPDQPSVCLLDTGVNQGHPLLSASLQMQDMHAYDPNWGVTDTQQPNGHGTQMAGLALFGDLTFPLEGNMPIQLTHCLESVKIIPPVGANDPKLYGAITKECVARAEIGAPQRSRVFSMQITSVDTRARGRPTSWSAELDQICAGAGESADNQRLVFVSAGNTDIQYSAEYPAKNETEQIHDPAQAWNAVTVGAFTNKVNIDQQAMPGWQPLAPDGALAPASTTSLVWNDQWPIKPDVVMEGGNKATNPADGSADYHDSLQLLSTNANFRSRLLGVTGDTSAATVLAARTAAIIQAEYPHYWPETLRALLIHSARWTPAMLDNVNVCDIPKSKWPSILRKFGYGSPNLQAALRSASSSVTLICQDEIQPFIIEDGQIKTNELKLHTLKWPREILLQYGLTQAEMRVTLSYFVEANPGPRQTNDRYRYASCGLRFDVKRPEEDDARFRARINREARDEENTGRAGAADSQDWDLGIKLRHRGSVHSDTWRGTAAQLAEKNQIAVYPVNGWWRLRPHLQRHNSRLRYALVVTIRTPEQDVDIYTAISTQVHVPVTIAIHQSV
ncbi:MAG: S8 family peptidase [Verrucomicrobiota bacterium]